MVLFVAAALAAAPPPPAADAAPPAPILGVAWETRDEWHARLTLARDLRDRLLRALGDATDPAWSHAEWAATLADGHAAFEREEAARLGDVKRFAADHRRAAEEFRTAELEVERQLRRAARKHARAQDLLDRLEDVRAWAEVEARAWPADDWAPVASAIAMSEASVAVYWYASLGERAEELDAWAEAQAALALTPDAPGLARARENLATADRVKRQAAARELAAIEAFAAVGQRRRHLASTRPVAASVERAGQELALEAEALIGSLDDAPHALPSTDDLVALFAMAGLGAFAGGDPDTGGRRLRDAAAVARDAGRAFPPDWPAPASGWADVAVADGPRVTVVVAVEPGNALWVDGRPQRPFGPNPLPEELTLTPGTHVLTQARRHDTTVTHRFVRVTDDLPTAQVEPAPAAGPAEASSPAPSHGPFAVGVTAGAHTRLGRVPAAVGGSLRYGRRAAVEVGVAALVFDDPLRLDGRAVTSRPQVTGALVLTPASAVSPRVAVGAFVDPALGGGPYAGFGLSAPIPPGRVDIASRVGVDVGPHLPGVPRATWALLATTWFSPRSAR